MDNESKKVFSAMQDIFETPISEKLCEIMKISTPTDEVQKLADQINKLIEFVTTDFLTGTYNREIGMMELEKIYADKATPKTTHCIIFIDIDNLKFINDTYGHCEGDYTIKVIAKALTSSVRNSDMVCRYGGDEFLIILKSANKQDAERILQEKVCKKLKHMEEINPKPYILSFSYGMVCFSSRTDSFSDVSELLRKADQKMYAFKNKRKMNIQRRADSQ